jgi:protease I
MTEKDQESSKACPCSQGIDRREFLKVAAVAGLLAGCSPSLESPTPTREPTATKTVKPTPAPGQTEVPNLAGKKALYVLPRDRYAVQCHDASAKVLQACGVEILLAALEKKEIVVWGGGTPSLTPDLLLSEVNVADFDAVIFECGQPLESYNPDYQNLARETFEQNKVLAAVCMWPALLASAGLLQDRKATSNSTEMVALQQFGAVPTDQDPVRDGNIVTASFNGISKFGWLVAEALTG